MNWLLIVVVLIFSWNMVRGYRKGILRMLYSFIAGILIMTIALAMTPKISAFLEQHTNLESNIEKKSHDKLSQMVVGSKEDESTKNENKNSKEGSTKDSTDKKSIDKTKEALNSMGIRLPESLIENMFESGNLADKIFEKTGVYDEISKKLATLAMTGISFALILVALILASHILLTVLKVVEEAPVIGTLNRLLGFFMGLIKGLVIVWVLFSIVAMNSTSEWGTNVIDCIYESQILKIIYENNIVLALIVQFISI